MYSAAISAPVTMCWVLFEAPIEVIFFMFNFLLSFVFSMGDTHFSEDGFELTAAILARMHLGFNTLFEFFRLISLQYINIGVIISVNIDNLSHSAS